MKTNLQKNKWVLIVNGLLAILFGGFALFATGELLLSISVYFGLLVLIGGVLLLVGAYDRRRKQADYALMLAEGLITVILGALIMLYPGASLKIFFVFIGIWALMLGLFKIYIAIALVKAKEYRSMFLIGGILMFGIGLLFLLDPAFVAGAILKIVGAIFIIMGMILVYFSFSMKSD